MNLKKQLIKSYIKMQLISSMPGELRIRIANLPKVSEEYRQFAPYVYQFIKMLNGIEEILTNFDTGEVTIYYNQLLQPQQVINWLNIVIDTAIDYMEVISSKWETDRENLIAMIQETLSNKLKKVM